MTGPVFVKWIETTLFQNDISKETFYAESGISTANMAQWRSGDYNPSKRSVQKAELFFEKYAKNEKPDSQKEVRLDEKTRRAIIQNMTAEELTEMIAECAAELKKMNSDAGQ